MQVIQEQVNRVKQPRAPRLSDEVWAANRVAIEQLYARENRPLKDVMQIMRERYNFNASRRQYEYHLAMWKVCKYAPRTAVPKMSMTLSDGLEDRSCGSTFHLDGTGLPETSVLAGAPSDFSSPTDPVTELLAMSQPLTPMLWDSTFSFIEQELAAFSGKDTNMAQCHVDKDASNLLTQFSDCSFIDVDHQLQDQHHRNHEIRGSMQPAVESQHHWQTPGSLSRLWDLEMPTSQRTNEQQSRVQQMIWCLWLCGNHDCFTNLARGVQFRIVRVEDDISRFESNLEKWIESSTGHPEIPSPSQKSRSSLSTFGDSGNPFDGVAGTSLRRESGVSGWHKHATIGHHIAMLKATGKAVQAKKLTLRLSSDLKVTAGKRVFFSSIFILLRLVQRCLAKELSHLRLLESDVRAFIKAALEQTPATLAAEDPLSTERKAIGVLSFLCYQRWIHDPGYAPEREAYVIASTGFPIAKAFQWILRLLIFHSRYGAGQSKTDVNPSPTAILLAPSSLCSRALSGLSVICLGEASLDDEIQVDKLASIWLDWLTRDSEWFLPSLLPMNLADSSTNIWQSIAQ